MFHFLQIPYRNRVPKGFRKIVSKRKSGMKNSILLLPFLPPLKVLARMYLGLLWTIFVEINVKVEVETRNELSTNFFPSKMSSLTGEMWSNKLPTLINRGHSWPRTKYSFSSIWKSKIWENYDSIFRTSVFEHSSWHKFHSYFWAYKFESISRIFDLEDRPTFSGFGLSSDHSF